MTVVTQRRLAWAGAAVLIAVFIAANLHLVLAAVRSQPDCVVRDGASVPARHSC